MNILLSVLTLTALAAETTVDGLQDRKIYECRYMENAPYGVTAWSQSEMVKTESAKESRFVPYNSEAAQKLTLDATTLRDVASNPELEDHQTSFYMAYNAKGWYIYVHSQEPDIELRADEGNDVSLELFFAPGMERVPYYQMIVRQLKGEVNHYDWGMPHRHYRSLKDSVRSESLVVDDGVATFLFIPWEILYDRVPIDGQLWRFSLMRWGGPSVTWGGKVHDTGNFGLIHFHLPSAEQRTALEKRILRKAWSSFRMTAKKTVTYWSDDEVGDPEFYNTTLTPIVDQYTAAGEALGPTESWDDNTIKAGRAFLANWMEFPYEVAELRTEYLIDKRFADSE